MEDKLKLMRKAMEIADKAIASDEFSDEMMDELSEIEAHGVYIGEILSFINYERSLKYPSEDGLVIET